MKRVPFEPRPDFRKELEDAGCFYHTIDGAPYWTEDAAYEFTSKQIDAIDDATSELHGLCVQLVHDAINKGDYRAWPLIDAIPDIKSLIQRSWEDQKVPIYGRFDLGYRDGMIKMFEYNADTPTSLPEASIWQWQWLTTKNIAFDQFNSIHEKLVKRWKNLLPHQQQSFVHFTMMQESNHEDAGNIAYMMETALEGGHHTSLIELEQIGWREGGNHFVDLADRDIEHCFKLYPWEWMLNDAFGWQTLQAETKFLEPAWKMLLSTKLLLPALWKKYPNHPNLLEAHMEKDIGSRIYSIDEWVRKPALGREGANITPICSVGRMLTEIKGEVNPVYDQGDYVIQEKMRVEPFEDAKGDLKFPVIGSWVIGHEPAGIGIREDNNWVTKDTSSFVPHYFVEE